MVAIIILFISIALIIILSCIFVLHHNQRKQLDEYTTRHQESMEDIMYILDAQNKERNKHFNSIHTNISGLKGTNQLTNAAAQLKESLRDNKTSLVGLSSTLAGNETKLNTMNSKLTVQNTLLRDLSTKVKDNTQVLNTIKTYLNPNTLESLKKIMTSDELLENILKTVSPGLIKPVIKKMLAGAFSMLIKTMQALNQDIIPGDKLLQVFDDNLAIMLKDIDIPLLFKQLDTCTDFIIAQSRQKLRRRQNYEEVVDEKYRLCHEKMMDITFWYSIYEKIHSNIKQHKNQFVFPEYKELSVFVTANDFAEYQIVFYTVLNSLAFIRIIKETEFREIMSSKENVNAFMSIVSSQLFSIVTVNMMNNSTTVDPQVWDAGYIDTVLQTMRQRALAQDQNVLVDEEQNS
jgi:hypothetical protein